MGDWDFQDRREEMARREVGHTQIRPALSRSLVLLFLLIILSVPVVEHLSALREYAARERSRPLPHAYEIFSLLPTPQSERERFYLMPQNVHFEHAAAMFSLKYHRPESWEQLDAALSSAWKQPGATLIELVVNEADGAQALQSLLAQVSQL